MAVQVGSVLEGTVSGITNFGAFVDLGDGEKGLVHISEVSSSYVKDIKDVLKINDKVKVKVLSVGDGKISLSIKQANHNKPSRKEVGSFEDKISRFLKDSDERLTTLKRNTECKRGGRGGRRA